MQVLQNKTFVALKDNTNVLTALDSQQQSSFLDDRAVTLKEDRDKTCSVDNDVIDFLLLMGKQTNEQLELISVYPNANKFKGINVSLEPDDIKMKGKIYDFF